METLYELIPNFDLWLRFGLSIALGGLIGLEREYAQQNVEPEGRSFAGIRTFPLIALLGSVAGLASDQQDSVVVSVVAFAGLAILTSVAYVRRLADERSEGITTEVTILLVFILGMIAYLGEASLASALAVIVAILLSLKRNLHDITRRLTQEDLLATLQFALIAVVILPLLPNRALDPLGVFNPYRVWLLVVLISGLNYGGYIAMKAFGAHRAVWLTGIFGGIASSTATTLSLANRSHHTPRLAPAFGVAIILASTIMYPRVALLLLATNQELFSYTLPFLGVLTVVGLLASVALWRVYQLPGEEREMQLENPLNLGGAIRFTLVFVVILFAVKFAELYLGTVGILITSLLAGLTGVDAIVLSLADISAGGTVSLTNAGAAVLLATLGNTIAKAMMAYTLANVQIRRPVIYGFSVLSVASLAVLGAIFVF